MKKSLGNKRRAKGATRKPRRVQPENWPAIHAYARALERFARSRNPDEFNELLIPHEQMAAALLDICFGADAREVFRQVGAPHRQNLTLFNRTRAYAYWNARLNGLVHQQAVVEAQEHFPNHPRVSAATITRLANRYQKEALARFEKAGRDVSGVRAQIAARSKRGKWD
jgi:hypothetical protein